MPLQRQKYWDTRAFAEFMDARAAVPFAWGVNDCLMFSADGLLAICAGDDVAADFRGRYSDEAGALATMQGVTGSEDMLTAVSVIAARHGLRKRPVARTAQRGDVVLVREGSGLMCALVGLSGRWVHAPGATGLRNICITSVLHAWTY